MAAGTVLMRSLTCLLLLPALVAIAGCGGDGGGEDEDAIRETLRLTSTTSDSRGDCRERFSDGFIDRTYGTRDRCVDVENEDDDDDPAKSVEIDAVEIDGDRATAKIELSGGRDDGVKGGVALVREAGDWRLDDFDADLLRSQLAAGLKSGDAAEELPEGAADCIVDGLGALSDPKLREVAYQLIGETPEAESRLLTFLADCEGEDGRSLLRATYEEGVAKTLTEGGLSQAQVECVTGGLRERVPDDRLIALLTSGGAARQEMARELAAAVEACGES